MSSILTKKGSGLEIIEPKYSINKFLVSEQPEIIEIIDHKKFQARIKIASYKGKWAYGYNLQFRYGRWCGTSSAPSFSQDEKMFDTRDLAFNAGLAFLLELAEEINPGDSIKYNKDGEQLSMPKIVSKEPLIEAIKSKMRHKAIQLSLF